MTQDVTSRSNGPASMLVVDFAIRIGNWTYLAGWAGPQVSEIRSASGKADYTCILSRFDRPDVAEAYGLPTGRELGFVAALAETGADLVLEWNVPDVNDVRQMPITTRDNLSEHEMRSLLPMIKQQIETLPRSSADWISHAVLVPDMDSSNTGIRGHLDLLLQHNTSGLIVSGWTIGKEGAEFFLMDGEQQIFALKGLDRLERNDLLNLDQMTPSQVSQAGFFGHIEANLTSPVQLIGVWNESVVLLSKAKPKALPTDPKEAARALFDFDVPIQRFHERVERIDWKFLAPIIAESQTRWDDYEIQERYVGPQPEQPEVSLIIPLYGRYDFIEHQLMEFCRDPYMRDRAEIIYVVDDPRIVDRSRAEMEELHGLYGQPYRWVWGGINRGFSGANNLGASRAHADRLLFMNSDVFPTEPGWLATMVEALDTHPKLGMVTPQLRFANGGIQHAGMVSRRLENLGIWINHHPYMGFDPSLDPHKTLDAVEIATGACMLVRRAEFEELGGWDTGYLIGDFEDSDLCFKYRSHDLDIGYLPTVSLVHLERQSFSGIGTNDFKHKVMIANSVRHAKRWPQFLPTN